jgi:hypothetical protein
MMAWSAGGRYRIVRIKRGQPHTVFLGRAAEAADDWQLSATVSTRDEPLARELERCRREGGVLELGQTDDDLPNHIKLERITTALRAWQQAHGRGGRAARAGS